MNCRRALGLPLIAGLALLGLAASLPAQIAVEGITDRGVYAVSVSFRVPSQPGFDDDIFLDGAVVFNDVSVLEDRPDYHELVINRRNTTTMAVTTRVVRFIVLAADRADTETGLPPSTPYPTIPSTAAELAQAHLDIITPAAFPLGMEIPVVAWVKNAQGDAVRASGLLTALGHPSILVRRGVGAGFLAATNAAGSLTYTARLPGIQTNKIIDVEAATPWTSVSGTLNGNTIWPEDSRIAVTGHLRIPAGSTLTIHDGSVVRLNSGVNITNLGRILIEGTAARPVVFTPVTRSQPWGGFFLTATTSQLDASGTLFVAAGSRQSGFPGHRSEQPLFYLDNRARVALTNCAAIYLAGQFHHSIDQGQPYASVTMVRSLIQRCTTAGEFNGCSLTFLQSALIDVPNEDQFFCDDPDCDHDGFYLNQGVHELRDSLVGWVKDDCIDAGSGGGPSGVIVSNCWLEGAYHEGLAWSGGGRQTRTFDTVLINCGQGLECGWSSGASSPLCYADGILSLANLVGARYGDNYQGTSGLGLKNGFLVVSNSLLLYNYRDVWGQVWDDTWNYRINNMDIHDNFLSRPNTNHPNNALWNPSTDGWRLAAFMTTPPNAPVGIGLATWTSQSDFSQFSRGLPVRLSSFTTNLVSVGYQVESLAGTLAGGTIQFAPGETVKTIPLSLGNPQSHGLIRVSLRNPVGGELTGSSQFYFLNLSPSVSGTVTNIPRGSSWRYLDNGSDQGMGWRLLGFNDGSWGQGAAPLGAGDPGMATTINLGPTGARYATTYFRRRFEVPNPNAFSELMINVRRDDGCIVYINDREVFRSNMPPGPVNSSTYTGSATSSETTFFSNTTNASVLVSGTNIAAVELHQDDAGSSDLVFDLELLSLPAPSLAVRRLGSDLILFWPGTGFELQSADRVNGPWTSLPGVTSPAVLTPLASQMFFRLKGDE